MRDTHAARYKAARNATGITIAEYEAREGLPLFSVLPEAEHARVPSDPGRFTYCNATERERVQLERDRSMPARGCIDCGRAGVFAVHALANGTRGGDRAEAPFDGIGPRNKSGLCASCRAAAKRRDTPRRVHPLDRERASPATAARLEGWLADTVAREGAAPLDPPSLSRLNLVSRPMTTSKAA